MPAGLVQIAPAQTTPFGLARVASPVTLFALSHEYTAHPLIWDPTTSGTGVIAHSTASNSVTLRTGGTVAGARAMRQTKVYHRYQPGKAQLVKATGVPVLSGDGEPFFFVRSSVSGSVVEERAYMNRIAGTTQWSDWDKRIDRSPTIPVDENKSVIVVIDLQWLGVGIVRCGFQFGDTISYAHKFQHAGIVTVPYMRTANLPLRYEVINAADGYTYALMGYFDDNDGVGFGVRLSAYADITMRQICGAIESEGGVQNPPSYPFKASNKGTLISAADSATLTPILTMRLVDTFGGITYRGHVNLGDLSWLNTSTSPGYWEMLLNVATLTSGGGAVNELTGGTWTSVDATYSGVQQNVAATAFTGGVSIGGGYISSSGAGNASKFITASKIENLIIMARTYANVRDTITIAARGIGGAATLGVTVPFGEEY